MAIENRMFPPDFPSTALGRCSVSPLLNAFEARNAARQHIEQAIRHANGNNAVIAHLNRAKNALKNAEKRV